MSNTIQQFYGVVIIYPLTNLSVSLVSLYEIADWTGEVMWIAVIQFKDQIPVYFMILLASALVNLDLWKHSRWIV